MYSTSLAFASGLPKRWPLSSATTVFAQLPVWTTVALGLALLAGAALAESESAPSEKAAATSRGRRVVVMRMGLVPCFRSRGRAPAIRAPRAAPDRRYRA